jgi:hypothetical protein
MAASLEGLTAFQGDLDAVTALRSALVGDDPRASFERADAAYRRRGLRFTIAVDVWALASKGAIDPSWAPLVDAAVADLRGAGAEWLAGEIVRLSA